MCKKMIYPIFFFALVLGLSTVRAQGPEWDRALYWDDQYPSAWAGGSTAIRDALEAAGYTVLDADQLKTWMDGHISDKALSVVVFCRDVVPDTVGETMSDTCTLRKYLDAGGKIVWYSDWPFYYQGSSDGSMVTWGSAGATSVLGFDASSGPNDSYDEVVFTDAGITWGLTTTWESQRPTSVTITENLTPLATISSGSAAAWVKHFLPGDKYRGFVRIYDTGGIPPSVDDIIRIAEYMATKAINPDPPDGAILRDTWVSMSWSAGASAESHDVYFGENYDDVEAGTGETFQGNHGLPYFVVGFTGYPYPDGLVPGTTYYWRVDEVDPGNTYKGDVWSFTVPSKKAFDPVPADGGKFIETEDVTLSWSPGFGAILHTVYFGDNFDDVNDAAGGSPLGFTNYNPGTLEAGKTYYWRVDEFEAQGTHKGDVWSFKTLPDITITDPSLIGWWKLDEGPGNLATDWSGHGNHGTLHGNPEWTVGYDGGALSCDGSGDWLDCGDDPSLEISGAVSVTAWINIGAAGIDHKVGGNQDNANGGYKMSVVNDKVEFEIRTSGNTAVLNRDVAGGTILEVGVWYHVTGIYSQQDGYIRTYVNGVLDRELLTNEVLGASPGTFYIGCEPYNTSAGNFNGVMDDIRIYNKALTQDQVKETMRGDPALAWNANPSNGSTSYIKDATPLGWSPGENASQHDVYFGTDKNAVDNADETDTTGIYRVRQSATAYTPPEGVEWGGGPYYWRIDQVNTDGTISTGRIWTFTVADFILVDDFEDYDAGENQIWYSWHDGLGYGTPGTADYFAGNGTGAAVGDETTPSYTEETIVHGGSKSMPLAYDNNKQGYSRYSETELTLTAPRDWTEEGVTELSLWFRGYPASTGSFVEGPVGTYTMTASGADIWVVNGVEADEFHFAYRMLTGAGSIVARVDSVQNTNDWAKAGVMIRETLDPDSAHAFACITPANGVASQYRPSTGGTSANTNQSGITAPYWVKLERSISGSFTVSHSANGSTWQPVTGATPQNIPMGANVYVGLALTSHDSALTCQAVFSNVTTTGTIGPQWAHQDIGITSNAAEPLYIAVSNSAGTPAVVVHDDPAAATIDTWTEWVVPLQAFADQGIVLTNVDRIAIGLGTKGNMTIPGGSGKMFFDDIRLYRPREAAE